LNETVNLRESSPVHFTLLKAASPFRVFFPSGAFRAGRLTHPGLLLVLALSWGAFGQPVGNSYQSLEALAADSELVVVGTIASVEDTNQPPSLDRLDAVKFSVKECLKGETSKVLQFVVPRWSWPDRELTNWVTSQTPLLVFLSESARLGNRQASRFRYAPRTPDAVVDLSSNALPRLLTPDFRPVRGVAAILAQARTAIAATKSGVYDIVSTNVPLDRVPKEYWASWAYLSVPVRREPGTVLRPDLSQRFNPRAQYDGYRVLAARGNGACLWDAETGRLERKFTGSAEEVQAVTFCPVGPFSPSKGQVLTGSGRRGGILGISKDNAIRLWNVEHGAVKRIFGPLMGPVMALNWGPEKL
jgi:hypothetical protein